MTCPTADKLSRFYDGLLTEERDELALHIEHCASCRLILEAFGQEDEFMKDTLQAPALPDDFADGILAGLDPYPRKKQRSRLLFLKRTAVAAAGLFLAAGIMSAFNPAFAQWIGGFFSSVNVDEGIQIAVEEGFAKRIDQSVTDQGLTFKVEDVVADSSRIALSYQLLDARGKRKDHELEIGEDFNKLYLLDEQGKEIERSGLSWGRQDGYGTIEFSLRDQTLTDTITVGFDLTELAGKKGSWKLEIPLDMKETLQATKAHDLSGFTHEANGIVIKMKEARFAPSSSEIFYETGFSKNLLREVEKKTESLEAKYGKEVVEPFSTPGTEIQYHIEDEKGLTVYRHSNYIGAPSSDDGLIQGTGDRLGALGQTAWNESFIPQRGERKLQFVLDGVIKTVPADFSITFEPKKLGKQPLTFKYEGNEMTITAAEMDTRLHLKKSLMPIGAEKTFQIEMEGSKTLLAPEMVSWVLVDSTGKAYETYRSGGRTHPDKDGRQETTTLLTVYGLEKAPEKLTLRLLSETRYEPLEKEWRIPIN